MPCMLSLNTILCPLGPPFHDHHIRRHHPHHHIHRHRCCIHRSHHPPSPPWQAPVCASLTMVFSRQDPSPAFRRSQLSLPTLQRRLPPSPLTFHVVDNPRGLSMSGPKPAHKQCNFTHVFSNSTPVSVLFFFFFLLPNLEYKVGFPTVGNG